MRASEAVETIADGKQGREPMQRSDEGEDKEICLSLGSRFGHA